MRRRLVIGSLLVLAVGAFVIVRSALDPDAIRGAAEVRLSAMLGQPVSIGRMHVSMLPVPAVVGSDIAVGPERERTDLSLQRVRVVPRLRSLFSGPYIVREVTLEGLTVRVLREIGNGGGWRFPSVVPAAGG